MRIYGRSFLILRAICSAKTGPLDTELFPNYYPPLCFIDIDFLVKTPTPVGTPGPQLIPNLRVVLDASSSVIRVIYNQVAATCVIRIS